MGDSTYKREIQDKYFRWISDLGGDLSVPLPRPKAARAKKQRESAAVPAITGLPPGLGNAGAFRTSYMVLDASHRNTTADPLISSFTLTLGEPLYDVIGLRLLRSEYNQGSAYTTQSPAYVYINNYTHAYVSNGYLPAIYTRILPGTDTMPAMTGGVLQDPYTFHLQPAEPRLQRFEIQLLTDQGQPLPVGSDATLVLTFCVIQLPRDLRVV